MTVLAASGLRKAFGGVQAVDGVGFSVAAGELLAMIGPNGAGKTTCFNLVNGQLQADAGEISFEGRRIERLSARARFRLGLGRSFQVAATFGSMTVQENVQVALHSSAGDLRSMISPLARAAEAIRLLQETGTAALAARQCAELAYGDLKRVEFAVALGGRPRLLLMDEPTAGMAAAERHELMELVRRISSAQGIAVIFTEHDMDIVFRHADRVIVLAEGCLIAQGTPAEVRADARVRRVYLGEDSIHA